MEVPDRSYLESLQHSTVIIRCVDKDGQRSCGTGFLFAFFKHADQHVLALVTNKHVVETANFGTLRWTLDTPDGKPDYGNFHDFEYRNFSKLWLHHPDPAVDLAIFPIIGDEFQKLIRLGKQPHAVAIIPDAIPPASVFNQFLALEDVVVVGYPDGISDLKNNIPVFRRGITATPLYIDFNGCREFLIDAAIFPGSSGSPVFVNNQGSWIDRKNQVNLGVRLALVGIVYAVAQHNVNGEIVILPAPTRSQQIAISLIPNNLGICIHASRILEFEPLLVQRGLKPPTGYVMRAKPEEAAEKSPSC